MLGRFDDLNPGKFTALVFLNHQLRETEHAIALTTLELFAYGTLRDYNSNPENFLTLSDSQVYRLKLLTLVSLAYHHKVCVVCPGSSGVVCCIYYIMTLCQMCDE